MFAYRSPLVFPNDAVIDRSLCSASVDLSRTMTFAVHVHWDGDPVGTLSLQIRNTDDENPLPWVDHPDASYALAGKGSVLFNIVDASFDSYRIRFQHESGGGRVRATHVEKREG
jgi:hypothetical protein